MRMWDIRGGGIGRGADLWARPAVKRGVGNGRHEGDKKARNSKKGVLTNSKDPGSRKGSSRYNPKRRLGGGTRFEVGVCYNWLRLATGVGKGKKDKKSSRKETRF